MAILKYTTSIEVEKTAHEIQSILAKAGANAVLCEYKNEVPESISFRIASAHGNILSFRLPARVEGCYNKMIEQGVPKKLQTHEQAARVSWRILKHWVEGQLAFIEAEQAELAELFLPYVQDPVSGKTMYETLKQNDFKLLSAP